LRVLGPQGRRGVGGVDYAVDWKESIGHRRIRENVIMKKKLPADVQAQVLSIMADLENSLIGQTQFQIYIKPLVAGGYSYDEARDYIRVPLTLVLLEASRDIPTSITTLDQAAAVEELMESVIGTLWFDGGKPKSEYGTRCIEEIDSRFKDLSKAGLTPEDVRDFWNLNYMDRHQVHLMSLVNAKLAFREAEQQLARSGPTADLTPELMAEASTITYAPVGSQVLFGERDALPAEASIRAPHLIAEFVANTADKFEMLEVVANISMNGLARVLLKG
jgi:hypothetical protein